MLRSFQSRLEALRKALDDEIMRQSCPVDPLSASLYEFGAYLDGLDPFSLERTAAELGISAEAVQSMARAYSR